MDIFSCSSDKDFGGMKPKLSPRQAEAEEEGAFWVVVNWWRPHSNTTDSPRRPDLS